MPVSPYLNQQEPDPQAVVWRFMNLSKFRDLMASEEIYFRRADLFEDKSEGIPPEEYAIKVMGLNPYDILDRAELNNMQGSIAQGREGYFICCWHLFQDETLDMWEQYGHNGVAIVSRYELLKGALNELPFDQAHIGLVRYGVEHLKGTFNALEFITTKQKIYEPEREVRTFIEVRNPLCCGNRHIDLNNVAHPAPLDVNPRHAWVQTGKKRRVNLRALILDIVISPWADAQTNVEIQQKRVSPIGAAVGAKERTHPNPQRVAKAEAKEAVLRARCSGDGAPDR